MYPWRGHPDWHSCFRTLLFVNTLVALQGLQNGAEARDHSQADQNDGSASHADVKSAVARGVTRHVSVSATGTVADEGDDKELARRVHKPVQPSSTLTDDLKRIEGNMTVDPPKGFCKGKFETYECAGLDANGNVAGGSKCNLTCTGKQKGYKPNVPSVNCKCQVNNDCYLKLGDFKCVSNTGGCFPRTAMLLGDSGEEISVAALQAGTQVMALDGQEVSHALRSSTFLGDTHDGYIEARDGSLHAFLEIYHSCGGARPLRITAEHLVYIVDPEAGSRRLERAGSLTPGDDYLLAMGCEGAHQASTDSRLHLAASRVLKVIEIWAEGFYNPVTRSGTAIVDGVATSNVALATAGISETWKASPSIRRNSEAIAQAIMIPPRVLPSLGVPWAWIHTRRVHSVYMSLIDAFLRLWAWTFPS